MAGRDRIADEVHVTAGVSPSDKGISLEREIALIKMGLLYGDRVTLCSAKASLLAQISVFCELSQAVQKQQIEAMIVALNDPLAHPRFKPIDASKQSESKLPMSFLCSGELRRCSRARPRK